MADLLGIIIMNVLGFLAWFYDRIKEGGNPLDIIIAIVVGVLTYVYDRGRRYDYLADRWNTLMNMNSNVPEFFDREKTKEFKSWFIGKTYTKYHQHARMWWGFVEDVIRNDYFWEPDPISYIKAYEDTINDFIKFHHAWLLENKDLFSYPRFSEVLEKSLDINIYLVGTEFQEAMKESLKNF